jgi:hypothetical protein
MHGIGTQIVTMATTDLLQLPLLAIIDHDWSLLMHIQCVSTPLVTLHLAKAHQW